MIRHALRAGEALAIAPDAIHRDADGFFFMLGPSAPDNEMSGTVAIVHVRGALSHYKTDGGDSYEGILERVALAIDGKPTSVLFRIESPGGVVSGLNECVLKLRKMSHDSGIPFIAYVDEMAASAAFAVSCGSAERYAPPSAVVGSVGVISTMVSQDKRDKADGLDFRLITSGARKADGHPHAPISDAAVAAETKRNGQLADQFFTLASQATGLSVKKLASLQAAIYLGNDAARVGLIDGVMSYDDVIGALNAVAQADPPAVAPNEGNVTDRRARPLDKMARDESACSREPSLTDEARMSVKLDSLITKTEAAIASETDPKKKARLSADLAAYHATKIRMEMPDGGDDDGGGDDDDDDEGDDSKSKKAAAKAEKDKRVAEAAKHRAKASEHKAKAAELEEMAKKCEESEEKSEESEAAAARRATDDATAESRAERDALAERVAALETDNAEKEKLALIADAKGKRITPAQAKVLAKEPLAYVKKYIEMAPKALVHTIDDGGLAPGAITPTGELPKSVMVEIAASVTETVAAMGDMPAEARKTMTEKLTAQLVSQRRTSNGIAGRV